MAGRPKTYTDEEKAQAIRNNARKAYLKKQNITEAQYNEWKERVSMDKQISKLRTQFKHLIDERNPTKISILTAVLTV